MKRSIPAGAAMLLTLAIMAAFCTHSARSQVDFNFGGNVAFEPQYWSKIGSGDDPKFGIGLSGMGGVALAIDSLMRVVVGPRISYSMWSADYSEKDQSATQSVYVNMTDMGLAVSAEFDDMWLQFGTGQSEITSGMMVSGKDIKYPYSGDKYTYYNVELGYKTGIFQLGIGYTSYTGYAQYCNHVGFVIGLGI